MTIADAMHIAKLLRNMPRRDMTLSKYQNIVEYFADAFEAKFSDHGVLEHSYKTKFNRARFYELAFQNKENPSEIVEKI